jgi:subtilisin family serine protease
LRRILPFIALVSVPVALWAVVARVNGPRVGPLRAQLPHVVRDPLASAASFPDPRADLGPGEEIRRLHARGITGRHVGIAIIDRPLLTRHEEFADRLRWYDEIDTELDEPAGWHSTAVASIAVGRRFGAAPMADLYFVGVGMNWAREPIGNWWVAARRAIHAGQTLPLAIRRILDLNRRLPVDRRIRAISISVGGGEAFEQAIDVARREGLFVSAADLHLPRLGPLTFASPTAPNAYTTGTVPAGSWAIAHMAGRYALACEENPGMTPERFMTQVGIRISR